MSNQGQNLNLARKWRSKNFDQIIGQDLCVRMLRNALYLNSFFPVYLFSGQRGCGKTSTARIFAAAVNCESLQNFQKEPKSVSVPCLMCVSCKAMQVGNHPDFIEMDAASHTGVDNVRQIMEAASFLPVMGKKKIYLIDEAHMLSKAAFNAFLKILEEPPASALFILATTDVQKIIDTVRSRSFQLFFLAVGEETLVAHLEAICDKESQLYDIAGLEMIVAQSGGSVRDAINLLEQVRFAYPSITKQSVLDVLGHLSDEYLIVIFQCLVIKKEPSLFLAFLDKINFSSYSPDYIWNRLIDMFRWAIRIKYGVKVRQDMQDMSEAVDTCSIGDINYCLSELCKNEILFSKSIQKHVFLEVLFLRLIAVQQPTSILNSDKNIDNKIIQNSGKKPQPTFDTGKVKEKEIVKDKIISAQTSENSLWDNFLTEFKKKLSDPVLNSVFTQAVFSGFDSKTNEIRVSFPVKFVFFKDLIDGASENWLPILKSVFNEQVSLISDFKELDKDINIVTKNNNIIKNNSNKKSVTDSIIDVSDKNKWQATNGLLNSFPGNISEIQEETD